MNKARDCFKQALKDEEKGKKHKGLLLARPSVEEAERYVKKARTNLELCAFYKEKGFDYKISEEWFYTLYYYALAILARFGVESRSQKCTALFIEYIKSKGLIDYEQEFITRISVHAEKSLKTDVDERETARYSSLTKSKEIESRYEYMDELCKKAISQAEDIIYEDKKFQVPEELYK